MALVAAERVAGVDQRHAEQGGEAGAYVARVGIVAVDQVGQALLGVQRGNQVVHERVEVVPQLLLRQVLVRSGVDAQDAGLVRQLLGGLGVVAVDLVVDDPAGDQIHLRDVVALRQSPRKFDDVEGLSPGIGIAPKLEVMAANETVDA